METEIEIRIAAPADTVFWLAARVERWPELLPHYRYVRVLCGDDHRRIVEMGAHRNGIPVSWTSIQEIEPGQRRIRFQHIRGATRGMAVEWRIEEQGDGSIATLWHQFNPPWSRGGKLFAKYIVGHFFIENIAGKTLRRLKTWAEDQPGSMNERTVT